MFGTRKSIIATKDPWLRKKADFRVEQHPIYEERNELMSSLIIPNQKQWNVPLIRDHFLIEDSSAILSIHVPQREAVDKVA